MKISLAENPLGGADFFKVEQGFADGAGSITAIVSRQHIEDAVSAVSLSLYLPIPKSIFSSMTLTAVTGVFSSYIEDAVSAVLMILPFTAILCIAISVLFALAYSRMFTRPIFSVWRGCGSFFFE